MHQPMTHGHTKAMTYQSAALSAPQAKSGKSGISQYASNRSFGRSSAGSNSQYYNSTRSFTSTRMSAQSSQSRPTDNPSPSSAAHGEERKFRCPHCPRSYNDNSALQKHVKSIHPPPGPVKKYRCLIPRRDRDEICGASFDAHRFDRIRKHWKEVHNIDLGKNPGRRKLTPEQEERMRGKWDVIEVYNGTKSSSRRHA